MREQAAQIVHFHEHADCPAQLNAQKSLFVQRRLANYANELDWTGCVLASFESNNLQHICSRAEFQFTRLSRSLQTPSSALHLRHCKAEDDAVQELILAPLQTLRQHTC